MIGSAGMLFTLYRWMVSRKRQVAEEMEYIRAQERELLRGLWNRYNMYRSAYQICDDCLDNDMMMTSQMTDTLKERLVDCQSLLGLSKPFIGKSVWDAYDGLLKAYNHLVEVVMWEMCGPERVNAFLCDSHSDICESETLLIELLWG